MQFNFKLLYNIILFLIFGWFDCKAQVQYIKVGVNGLTCSACCRSVETGIMKLKNVKEVKMNLDNSEGKIYFIDGENVNIESIARAVVKAGFSVRFISAIYHFNNVKVANGFCYNAGNCNFQFIHVNDKVLNGEIELKLIGEKFQKKSEYLKIKANLTNLCSDKNIPNYFVTL